ncbi:MAG: GNAT family N-acetyltransferase [Cytophagales bacterium]|nr:GNAT family N-acetyltransferase [Rhizobacter sp.]
MREAQRLRYRVFAGEMGACLQAAPGVPPAHDDDPFDAFCGHLVVRAQNNVRHGEVIATCRVLAPEGARCAGSLYTDSEFDLGPLRDLLPRTMEMGRVCVDPAWRNGLVVMALWRELGDYMLQQGMQSMIGCSSVSMSDGGELAARLWHRLKLTHLVAAERQVRPRRALPLPRIEDGVTAAVPALIKGYLRCGGKLLGPPAVDAAFNTADFPMMLQLQDMPARYSRRIFGAST